MGKRLTPFIPATRRALARLPFEVLAQAATQLSLNVDSGDAGSRPLLEEVFTVIRDQVIQEMTHESVLLRIRTN